MTDLSRALLFSQRSNPRPRRRHWTPAEIERLASLVSTLPLPEIAAALGRTRNAVGTKLQYLGYSIQADVNLPLGLSAAALARHLAIPLAIVYRAVETGALPADRHGKKDYLITWKAVRRYERQIAGLRRRRERLLARITEPTISKPEFERLLGLSETHAQRYLKGKIVRAWKVPCEYSNVSRFRWEWRVSLADAERAKRARAEGRLSLQRKAFRSLPQCTAEDMRRRRREGRLGSGAGDRRRACVVPGQFSVADAAEIAGVSREVIYRDIRVGRLAARRIQIGRRPFLAISPDSLSDYVKSHPKTA